MEAIGNVIWAILKIVSWLVISYVCLLIVLVIITKITVFINRFKK